MIERALEVWLRLESVLAWMLRLSEAKTEQEAVQLLERLRSGATSGTL